MSHNIIKTGILGSFGHLSGHYIYGFCSYFWVAKYIAEAYNISRFNILYNFFWYKNRNSDFKKHFLILIFMFCPKWWSCSYFRIFWRPFWRRPISRISKILKICYILLLLTVYCIQIWFLTSKTFSRHLSVQIIDKVVSFCLFQDILVAI